jgi:uncharacterized ubiquitin-like protein YukD
MTTMLASIEQVLRMASYVATPIVAVAATVIAWQQMKVNQRKYDADLYDRRLRVYEEVRKLLSIATREGDVSTRDVLLFRVAVSEADFLFGSDVSIYIEQLYKRAIDLGRWSDEMRTPKEARPADYDHKKVVDEKYNALRWLAAQYEPAKNLFGEYLAIGAYKIRAKGRAR